MNPMNLYQRTGALLFVFSCAALGAGFIAGRRAPYAHCLAAAGFGALASLASRQAVYFSLTIYPLALSVVYPLPSPSWWTRVRPYVLGALFILLAATGSRVLRNERLFSGIDATRGRSPVAAGDFLRRNKSFLARLPMYNSWNYGGYLGYALGPDYKIFMDGRYIFTEFLPLIRGALESPAAWQDFLTARGVSLVIVERTGIAVKDPSGRSDLWRPIDVYFMPQNEWALVYWDSQSVVWVRRSSAPRDWLLRNEFSSIFPGDTQFMSLRVLSGALPLASASKEVSRYVREIRDVPESDKLMRWIGEIER
jgi:hypothetical protein